MKPEEKSRYKQLRCVNFVDASADFDYRKNTLFRDRVEQGMPVPGYKGWGWLLGG